MWRFVTSNSNPLDDEDDADDEEEGGADDEDKEEDDDVTICNLKIKSAWWWGADDEEEDGAVRLFAFKLPHLWKRRSSWEPKLDQTGLRNWEDRRSITQQSI